jgi:hypothetical protein
MKKQTVKHTAKRIAKGHYAYRGYIIKSFDQKWLLDPELQAVVWYVYGICNDNPLEIAFSFGDAKSFVNQLLVGWENNERLTAAAQATPIANDDLGREFHGIAS